MTNLAIRVERLSKQYRIVGPQAPREILVGDLKGTIRISRPILLLGM